MVGKFDFVSSSLTEELLPHEYKFNINKKKIQELLLDINSGSFPSFPPNPLELVLTNYYPCRISLLIMVQWHEKSLIMTL